MITLADARAQAGQTFRLTTDDPAAPLPLTLAEVRESSPGGSYCQFSLLFQGPLEPSLVQQTYLLSSDQLTQMPIFLVPVAADAQHRYYQAIFSYPRTEQTSS